MLSPEDRQRFIEVASRYFAQIERIEFKQPERGVIAPEVAALADPPRDALFEVIQDLRAKYGNDIVFGEGGFNLIVGGEHNDQITGGNSGNLLIGDAYQSPLVPVDLAALKSFEWVSRVGFNPLGSGVDTITGGTGFDFMIGGEEMDTLVGGGGFNIAFGDAFHAEVAIRWQFGLGFADPLTVLLLPVVRFDEIKSIFALAGVGDDTFVGGAGTDIAIGGAGNDKLYGNSGFDFLIGGAGHDIVDAGPGSAPNIGGVAFGGHGNDQLFGGDGPDYLESEEGNDVFRGGPGDDRIYGGADNDILYGDEGNDQLFGEEGDDTFYGGMGTDTLNGGPGVNQLSGNNVAPVIGSIGSPITYRQDAPPIALLAAGTVTDPDSADFSAGELLVRIVEGGNSSNRLLLGGEFSRSGSNVRYRGETIGTLNANGGVGTTKLEVTFNASARRAIVELLLRSIRFQTVSGTSTARRVVEFSLTDGDGGVSNAVTKSVNVTSAST